MDYKAQITEREQAIRRRMDQLAAADPTCNRLMGQIDTLREMDKEPVEGEGEDAESAE